MRALMSLEMFRSLEAARAQAALQLLGRRLLTRKLHDLPEPMQAMPYAE